MDLNTQVPEKQALYDGTPKDLKLSFSMSPFTLPTGKFINVLLPNEGKSPAFVLKNVKMGYGWSEKYRSISIPAHPGSDANEIASRLAELATKAAVVNSMAWFGKSAEIVKQAVTVKAGLRESQGQAYLTLKAPTQDEDPSFFDVDGSTIPSNTDTRGCVADVLFICNGVFIRGLDVFVQLKCIAIALTSKASNVNDATRKLQAFTIVE